ncbi:MAG: NAD+ synthase [Pseudomonadota bacterium]
MRLAWMQFNALVGDIDGNAQRIRQGLEHAQQKNVDILICPELALIGYPPEDLLLRSSVKPRVHSALSILIEQQKKSDANTVLVIGAPGSIEHQTTNGAVVIFPNGETRWYAKQFLPNYSVFDEQRYFVTGQSSLTITAALHEFGILICEDLWHPQPARRAVAEGAECIICLNASPYHMNKHARRLTTAHARAEENKIPIVYVNLIGGQDELVFDGQSFVMNAKGQVAFQEQLCTERWTILEWQRANDEWNVIESVDLEPIIPNEKNTSNFFPRLNAKPVNTSPELIKINNVKKDSPHIWLEVLKLGLRDYLQKNDFPGIILGLSGGIDSALTLAIAVEALGKKAVHAVMMPSQFTSEHSIKLAAQQAEWLDVKYHTIPIDALVKSFEHELTLKYSDPFKSITSENIQARCRGVLLMALSNQNGFIVLNTSNKSETAVGYSTLYGDMIGGFNLLKDLTKTQVYQLARWMNQQNRVIPEEVITRAPSAELRANQTDQDTLPSYDVLDQLLTLYVEQDKSAQELIDQGFAEKLVYSVIQRVDQNEYKRRQAPPGVRMTEKAFGRDRRYPMSNGWKPGI